MGGDPCAAVVPDDVDDAGECGHGLLLPQDALRHGYVQSNSLDRERKGECSKKTKMKGRENVTGVGASRYEQCGVV